MVGDLCEYAGNCALYNSCVGRDDEDSCLQIGDICMNSTTRVGESCYKDSKELEALVEASK